MPNQNGRPQIDVHAVVFATDFSSCCENAGHFARLIADCLSANLFVAHAFHLAQAAMEVEASGRMESRQREELEKMLGHTAEDLGSGSLQTIPVLLEGAPHEVIPKLAEKHAPSVIVMGTRGCNWLAHELIGSVAEEILRSTQLPCLTIGPNAPMAAAHSLPFRRILYATDFTPAAAHAALYALTVAEAADAAIDVLNVVPEGSLHEPGRRAEMETSFYHALEELVPEQARAHCHPRTFVEAGSAYGRILGHIREHGDDLLVLGIHKSSHLGLKMRTSGAFRLIAEAPCPVLSITA